MTSPTTVDKKPNQKERKLSVSEGMEAEAKAIESTFPKIQHSKTIDRGKVRAQTLSDWIQPVKALEAYAEARDKVLVEVVVEMETAIIGETRISSNSSKSQEPPVRQGESTNRRLTDSK